MFKKEKLIYIMESVEHIPVLVNLLYKANVDTPEQACDMVHFRSDCANNFQSYENLEYTAVDVPKDYNTDTRTSKSC